MRRPRSMECTRHARGARRHRDAPCHAACPRTRSTAARAYIDANRDLLGLTQSGAAALEVVTVAPIGQGSAVLLRQRFGDLAGGRRRR